VAVASAGTDQNSHEVNKLYQFDILDRTRRVNGLRGV